MTGRPVTAALKSLLSAAVFFASMAALDAAWIPLKAGLAQLLLQHSWARQKAGENVKPWPWADTHAIARLQVPRLGVHQIVLAGSSGRNLAFGPTSVSGSGAGLSGSDERHRDWIINGHRDTHFRFLQYLQAGDVVVLETSAGLQSFAVDSIEIIDSRQFDLVLEPGLHRLSLVTCYPFDAVTAGGPLRYVVTALPLETSAGGEDETAISPPVASSG
jgi:sortase A